MRIGIVPGRHVWRPMARAMSHALLVIVVVSASSMRDVAAADAFPSRPIHLIVPFAAGNQLDVFARLIGARMTDAMGQPVIVENRAGVSGNVASEAVARAAPDGYTLLLSGVLITLLPLTYGARAVDPVMAFAPVTRLAQQPMVIVVNATLPVHSLAELLALARKEPGKITYATAGVGTAQHVAMSMLSQRAGVAFLHVPYANSGQLVGDVLSGEVPMAISYFGTMESHLKSGRLRALAVTSLQRVAASPSIPTVAESGFPGYEFLAWTGVLAPAGTPPEVVGRLHHELVRIIDIPEVREVFHMQGAQVVGNSPEQFAAEIKSSMARWSPVVREAHIHVE